MGHPIDYIHPRSLQDTKYRLLRRGSHTSTSWLKTLTASDAAVDCLVLRIRKMGPSNRRAHAGASKIPARKTLAVESGVCLVLGDLSPVGCGGGLPRIAHSQKWDLESANTQCRAHDSRSRYYHRTVCPLLGAWGPEPSGMRNAALDCLALRILKMGPPIDNINPRALRDTHDSHVRRDRICPLHV